jgi:hypothetical protein
MEPWEKHEGCTCVECPVCAFLFDDSHVDHGTDEVRYSCPNCAEDALLGRVRDLEAALRGLRLDGLPPVLYEDDFGPVGLHFKPAELRAARAALAPAENQPEGDET